MKSQKILVFFLISGALLLQACGGSESAIATAIAETLQISQLQTAAAGGGAAVQEQPATTDTPSPGLAFVSVSQNTNCRSGPRLDYTLLTTIDVGQPVEVLKTFSNEYVLVKNPNGPGDCWLFLQFADTTDFSAFDLAVATQPPTPDVANQSSTIEVATQPSSFPTNTPTASKTPTPTQTPTEELHIRAELNVTGEIECSDQTLIKAQITVNQPVNISFWWENSEGQHTPKETLEFAEKGSEHFTRGFLLDSFVGWIRLYIGSPLQIYSNKIDVDCGS